MDRGDCNALATIGLVRPRLVLLLVADAGCGRVRARREHACPARAAERAAGDDRHVSRRSRRDRRRAGDRSLAATGLRFTSARTTVPLTLPAHSTDSHRSAAARARRSRERRRARRDASDDRAAPRRPGYDTAAFVGAFVLDRRFGLAQGFTRVRRSDPARSECHRTPRSGAPGVSGRRPRARVA